MEYTKEDLVKRQLESPSRKLRRCMGVQDICAVPVNYTQLIARSLDNLTAGMGEIIDYIREQKEKENEENRRNRNKKKKRGKVIRTSKK